MRRKDIEPRPPERSGSNRSGVLLDGSPCYHLRVNWFPVAFVYIVSWTPLIVRSCWPWSKSSMIDMCHFVALAPFVAKNLVHFSASPRLRGRILEYAIPALPPRFRPHRSPEVGPAAAGQFPLPDSHPRFVRRSSLTAGTAQARR